VGKFLAACLVFQKSTSGDAITCIFIISALFLTQEAISYMQQNNLLLITRYVLSDSEKSYIDHW
jgi:hypothetical protein